MTSIDLRKIARLARLELSAAEIARFTPQLEKILGLMAELDTLPLAGAEPFRPGAAQLSLRADEPAASLAPAGVLRNAPAREGALVTVPSGAGRAGAQSAKKTEPGS